jgi:16S rRNA (adenine1518-N6/adenine1519-N6)-dimethyltransferase
VTDNGRQAKGEIRRLLEDHGHQTRKAYGQNFLADPNIVDRIVSVADIDGDSDVVEIGAGTGALTVALARVAHTVVAYEIDHSFESILGETLAPHSNVDLRFADVSRLSLGRVLAGAPWSMVSNLPYNVGTGIVLDALKDAPAITKLVVMVQKEVADRMLAEPGSKTYGIPSVVVGLHAVGHLAFTVPAKAFVPAPKVESAVVVLDRIPAPDLSDRAIALATAAFGQRRKMLRKSLAGTIKSMGCFAVAGIEPTARPEDLTPQEFVALAGAEATI